MELNSEASIWFEIWGFVDLGPKFFGFSRQICEKFRFFRANWRKISTFFRQKFSNDHFQSFTHKCPFIQTRSRPPRSHDPLQSHDPQPKIWGSWHPQPPSIDAYDWIKWNAELNDTEHNSIIIEYQVRIEFFHRIIIIMCHAVLHSWTWVSLQSSLCIEWDGIECRIVSNSLMLWPAMILQASSPTIAFQHWCFWNSWVRLYRYTKSLEDEYPDEGHSLSGIAIGWWRSVPIKRPYA